MVTFAERAEDSVNVPVMVPLIVAEDAIELLPAIAFTPTFRVDPEDDIEETPFIST